MARRSRCRLVARISDLAGLIPVKRSRKGIAERPPQPGPLSGEIAKLRRRKAVA